MAQEAPACAVVDKTKIALPRILSLWDVVMIVIGGVVGSGIFLTQPVARRPRRHGQGIRRCLP